MTASSATGVASPTAQAQRKGTILLADHDAEARSRAATVLGKGGYLVIEVDNGDDAIEAVRRDTPCLVILEVTLPGLSGYEVCHQLKEDFGQGLPIVLVSGE